MSRGKNEDDAERRINQWEKRAERSEASDNVMENCEKIKLFGIAIHA